MAKTNLSLCAASASLVLLGFCVNAFAQTETPNNTAKIQAVSEERALIEAEIKRAESRKKLDDVKGVNFPVSAGVGRAPSGGHGPSQTVNRIEAEQEMNGLPTVSHVEGRKGSLEAVLVYRNGAKQRVKTGDKVLGTTVQKIALNEVALVDPVGKSMVRLQFANAASQGQQPGQTPMGVMPGGVPTVPMPNGLR